MNSAGIYCIQVARPDGSQFYVGQSICMRRRFNQHLRDLRLGRHSNARLQALWRAIGPEAFSFHALEVVSDSAMLDREEDWWLSELHGRPCCLNLARHPGASLRGVKLTDQHRARISAALAGERHYNYGREMSPEARAARSATLSGRAKSDTMRARLAAAVRGARNPMAGRCGVLSARATPVVATCLKTGVERAYESMTLAERDGFRQECISRVCDGISRSHAGYSWRRATPESA